jgi:hypothetical protein
MIPPIIKSSKRKIVSRGKNFNGVREKKKKRIGRGGIESRKSQSVVSSDNLGLWTSINSQLVTVLLNTATPRAARAVY